MGLGSVVFHCIAIEGLGWILELLDFASMTKTTDWFILILSYLLSLPMALLLSTYRKESNGMTSTIQASFSSAQGENLRWVRDESQHVLGKEWNVFLLCFPCFCWNIAI